MPIVDPNAGPSLSAGDKVVTLCGFSKGKSAQKQTPQYEVCWVVVKDLAAVQGGDGDKEDVVFDNFYLVENALFRLGNAMKAAGRTTPFDSDDSKLVADQFANAFLIVTLAPETYNSETRMKVKAYKPYTGTEEPDWAEVIAKGEKSYKAIVAKRQNGAGGGSSGGGGGGGQQRRQVGGGGGGGDFDPSAGGGDDEPMPF